MQKLLVKCYHCELDMYTNEGAVAWHQGEQILICNDCDDHVFETCEKCQHKVHIEDLHTVDVSPRFGRRIWKELCQDCWDALEDARDREAEMRFEERRLMG